MFNLLSAMTLGSVFALKCAKAGPGAAQQDLLRRALRLYRTHLLVFFIFAAMVLAADIVFRVPIAVERFGWQYLVDAPFQAVAAGLTGAFQPDFVGALPVFVFGMLLLGPFLMPVRRIGA